jgi:hypothetical protein
VLRTMNPINPVTTAAKPPLMSALRWRDVTSAGSGPGAPCAGAVCGRARRAGSLRRS